jgi:DNA-binding NarL/FixJ family response regulator
VNARVLVVDDHELLAESLAFRLQRAGLEARPAATESAEAIIGSARAFRPDAVLLDLMLGEESSVGLIRPIVEASGAAVLVVTGVTDRPRLAECIEAGAVGVVGKSRGFDELLDRVLEAVRGEAPLRVGERVALLQELALRRAEEKRRREPFEALTRREQEILAALMDGKRPKEIAAEAYVGVGTVRSQIKTIHQKLGVSSQLAAVALARMAGWALE